MRIRDPKTTALIFASGKMVRRGRRAGHGSARLGLRAAPFAAAARRAPDARPSPPQVCTGAKTEAMAKLAARKYARIIQKLGFPAQFKARQGFYARAPRRASLRAADTRRDSLLNVP